MKKTKIFSVILLLALELGLPREGLASFCMMDALLQNYFEGGAPTVFRGASHYQSAFELSTNSQNQKQVFEAVTKKVLDWVVSNQVVQARVMKTNSAEIWKNLTPENIFDGGVWEQSGVKLEARAIRVDPKAKVPEGLAIHLTHPCKSCFSRNWGVDIGMTQSGDQIKMSVHVSYDYRPGSFDQKEDLPFGAPRLISEIQSLGVLMKSGSGLLQGTTTQVRESEVPQVAHWINDPNRQVPLLLVSKGRNPEGAMVPLVNADWIAKSTFGSAAVLVIEGSRVGDALKKKLESDVLPWGGAVRVYPPGFNSQSPHASSNSPYLSPAQISQAPFSSYDPVIAKALSRAVEPKDRIRTLQDVRFVSQVLELERAKNTMNSQAVRQNQAASQLLERKSGELDQAIERIKQLEETQQQQMTRLRQLEAEIANELDQKNHLLLKVSRLEAERDSAINRNLKISSEREKAQKELDGLKTEFENLSRKLKIVEAELEGRRNSEGPQPTPLEGRVRLLEAQLTQLLLNTQGKPSQPDASEGTSKPDSAVAVQKPDAPHEEISAELVQLYVEELNTSRALNRQLSQEYLTLLEKAKSQLSSEGLKRFAPALGPSRAEPAWSTVELAKQYETLESEVEFFNNENLSLKNRAEELKALLAQSQEDRPPPKTEVPVGAVQKPKKRAPPNLEVLREMADTYKDEIVVLDQAMESAEEARFQDPKVSKEIIEKGVLKFWELLFEENLTGAPLFNAYNSESTFNIAMRESQKTMRIQKSRQDRTFIYEGVQGIAEIHLKYGNTPERSMRVYLHIDRKNRKIVITHFGDHLETASTN